MQEAIDRALADEAGHSAFFLAPSGREKNELGKLGLQARQHRSGIAYDLQIGDENAAMAAHEQFDRGLGGRRVPEDVFGSCGLLKGREQRVIGADHDYIYSASRKSAGSAECACGFMLPALHCIG